MSKKSYEDEDSRQLKKANTHDRKNKNRKGRKNTKRVLNDYLRREDDFDGEDYDFDDEFE